MGYNTHHSSQNCHKEDGGFYLILSTISLFCLKDIFVKENQYSCNPIRDPFMDAVLRGQKEKSPAPQRDSNPISYESCAPLVPQKVKLNPETNPKAHTSLQAVVYKSPLSLRAMHGPRTKRHLPSRLYIQCHQRLSRCKWQVLTRAPYRYRGLGVRCLRSNDTSAYCSCVTNASQLRHSLEFESHFLPFVKHLIEIGRVRHPPERNNERSKKIISVTIQKFR